MFETAEVGHKLSKVEFKKHAPSVREALLEAQYELRRAPFPVLVLINGVEAAGKGDCVNLLLEWLDARFVEVHAFGARSDEERERPFMWRYWRALPERGRMGIYFGNWYTYPIVASVMGEIGRAELDYHCDRIVNFERLIAADGALVLKFWFHMSRKDQKERIAEILSDKDNSWRLTKADLKYTKRYDEFLPVCEHVLGRTHQAAAPWRLVESTDRHYRDLTVAQTILKELQARLSSIPAAAPRKAPKPPQPERPNILTALDYGRKISEKDYDRRLEKLQRRLALAARKLPEARKSAILVFEGSDAAGKGGAIRRIAQALDARHYRVIPVAAPTDEERRHPYLWRFWRHLPRQGRITVYDRSWYGRVLVERIEGFCAPEEWKRAYAEINDFEEELEASGVAVLKFYLAITPDEQLRRFKDREHTGYKRHKLTDEDWRNREKAGAYEAAACDMFAATSTDNAPWKVIPANDKQHARIAVLEAVVERLEGLLGKRR